MKKTVITVAVMLSSFAVMAQSSAKKDTAKTKYDYFVVLPASDFNQIASSLNEYKRLQMFDPNSSDKQKVELFQGIEGYIKALQTRIKIDSVKSVPAKGGSK